ncbi:unnamed protein product [Durusdinium trenchii]|uniref:Uncharacterized protein n=1 Tax=Durusdinium trenchii TaxID=1381693 RepID=A0ABP0MJA9_9DINO
MHPCRLFPKEVFWNTAGRTIHGSMSNSSSNDVPSSRALEEFFRFMQCQLRMEAEGCLQEDLELPEREANFWQTFRTWVQPNLGKKEKWMPFHTVLGSHELFIVQNIHHNKDLPWNEKRRFLAMFVFRAHCRSNVFREAQLPLMLEEDFWRDPVAQFADDGPATQCMLVYRRKSRQPLQTSAFLAIPERLCQDDDENLARNVAMRTRTLLEVAEKVWPIVHNAKLPSLEKFEEISKTIQAGRRLGETWSKMLMVSIDIAYPHLQLLASTCDVGVGALKALQRLFPSNSMDDPRDVLGNATRAANSSQASAAQSFWRLLAKVESLAQKRFAQLPLVLEQVSTRPGQLSAVTMQVQLCEWRQFLDFLAKAGTPDGLDEEATEEVSGPAKKARRITGKRRADDIGVAPEAEHEDLPDADSEDEMPLSNICMPRMHRVTQVPQVKSNGVQVVCQHESPEGAYANAAREALGQYRAKVASARNAVKAHEAQVQRSKADCEEATSQAMTALRRSSLAEEAVRSAEIETMQLEYLLQASHTKTGVTQDLYQKLDDAGAKLSEGQFEVFAGLPSLAKESSLLPRLSTAAESRMAHIESLMQELENDARAEEMAREPYVDQHAELVSRSSTALQERAAAREAVLATREALRLAQQRCQEALQQLNQQRLALQLAEAEVLSLEQLL